MNTTQLCSLDFHHQKIKKEQLFKGAPFSPTELDCDISKHSVLKMPKHLVLTGNVQTIL